MNPKTSEFSKAIERICAGSPDAVWEFIESYGPHIQRVVRRRLNHSMRSKFDSGDFVQMVWASFFANPSQIAKFKEPDQLIKYLVSMARNKVVEETRRRLKYQQHNVRKEFSYEFNATSRSTADRNQDTPSAIAIARERWRSMMHSQSDRDQQVVRLRISGVTYVEIGKRLGIHERTARQVIAELSDVG